MKVGFPVLLALAGLAGCSGASVTGTGDVATFYDRSLVVEATRADDLPLVVHGRPTALLDEAQTVRLLVRAVSLPAWTVRGGLRPGGNGEPYRLVLIFNPASFADAANHPCGPLDGLASLPPGPQVRVVAAFCAGDRAASMNSGNFAADRGSGGLEALVRQLVHSLFPAINPTLREGEDLPI